MTQDNAQDTATIDQRSPARRVTASIVGAILGNAPYMTRDDAMRSMVRATMGAETEFEPNLATEYGKSSEGNALFEYQLATGYTPEPCDFVDVDDWAFADPKFLIGTDGGLDLKCPFGKRKEENPQFASINNGELPHHYDRVQFLLWATDRKWFDFSQWSVNGNRTETVIPSQQWRDENLPRLKQFYAEYLDALKSPDDYLAPKRVTIDTPEAARMVAEYDELSEAIDNATAKQAELLADMVRIAGDKNAIIAGRKLTQTHRKGSVSYAKALKELAPDADLEKWRGKASSSWGLK